LLQGKTNKAKANTPSASASTRQASTSTPFRKGELKENSNAVNSPFLKGVAGFA